LAGEPSKSHSILEGVRLDNPGSSTWDGDWDFFRRCIPPVARGAGWRLGLYIILGVAGFWIGHVVALSGSWNFIRVGSLQLGAGTAGSIILIGLGYWLSNKQPEQNVQPGRSTKKGGRG